MATDPMTTALSGLESLFDDILIHIVMALPVEDILNVRLASKRLENITRMRSVWFNVLLRETIDSGRPLPGHAVKRLTTDPKRTRTSYLDTFYQDFALLEAQDLEERTHFALWLDNRWGGGESKGNSGGTCMTSSFEFRAHTSVRDVFIVPGGRYLITAHDSELRCWDVGFPEVPRSQNKTERGVSCIGEWFTKKHSNDVSIASITVPDMSKTVTRNRHASSSEMRVALLGTLAETSLYVIQRADRIARHSSIPSDFSRLDFGKEKATRLCSIISVNCNSIHVNDTFSTTATVTIPTNIPGTEVRDEDGNLIRFGALGNILYFHSNLLYFSSFVVRGEDCSDSGVHAVGVEVIDWALPDPFSRTALFIHPDTGFGPFIDMHVYEETNHVLFVWRRCVGLYPIPDLSTNKNESGRLIVAPTIFFSIAEEIETPVSFSPCNMHSRKDEKSNEYIPPLTVVARSRSRPHTLSHSILTATVHPSDPSSPTTKSPTYEFRLSRIPTPSPFPYFWTSNAQSNENLVGFGANRTLPAHSTGIAALAIGASGRGLRADADGGLFKCTTTPVLLPWLRHDGSGAGAGDWETGISEESSPIAKDPNGSLLMTVDFWPFQCLGSIPLLDTSANSDGLGDNSTGPRDKRLIMRFDEGIGRAVVVHTDVEGITDTEQDCRSKVVTIMDFA